MKTIQSCWSCGQTDLLSFNSGWLAPEYHLMGWALSCLQLKKHCNKIELYTDRVGAKMLIDRLKLPYDNVICSLDELNHYESQLFAVAKIHTYSLQTSPFLHVDADVFIWKEFDNSLLSSGLIAQNIEAGTQYYEMIMQSLESELTYFPLEIIEERKKHTPIYAYNAGIFGGNDIDFFRLYTRKAKEFVNRNKHNFLRTPLFNFNIFFEQYLFYCLTKKYNKNVSVLLNDVIEDLHYTGFGDFIEVPHNKQYLHLIGIYKRNKKVCQQMANRLRQDYPDYYYRIIALFKDKNVALKKDYYFNFDKPEETHLTDRYVKLKNDGADKMNTADKVVVNTNSTSELNLMVKFVIETINAHENKIAYSNKTHNYNNHIKDLHSFENKLIYIFKNKLSTYNREYLYARDICSTQYFQLLFEDKTRFCDTVLIADTIVEKVTSKFNWAEIEMDTSEVLKILASKPSRFCTMVVPECDIQGYSLVGIDELDCFILEMLKKPFTIANILNDAKRAFDPADLENSIDEFKPLILSRVKMLLETKLITVYG